MVDFVAKYNIEVTNGMTKEEFNIAVDLCVKYIKNELPKQIAKGLCFDSEVMNTANFHIVEEETEAIAKWHDEEYLDSAENFIRKELKRDSRPVKIDNNFKIGHGHTLSVKIVMPCYCQANCPFCFNKQTSETQVHDFNGFYESLKTSLDLLFNTIHNRKISLDITGNEPTFNVKEFKQVLGLLKEYRDKYLPFIDKIVLTTNGYHLLDCIDEIACVVDIVNISVHHYDYEVRRSKIFRTKYVPSNEDLKLINQKLHGLGVKTTSIGVIYEPIDEYLDYVIYILQFADVSKELGFDNTRIRLDFTDETGSMDKIFNYSFTEEIVQKQSGLHTKIIDRNGYEIRVYKGVKDLVDYVIGVEMVIDDDGKLYLDYNKRFPLENREYWYDFNYNIFPLE